MGSSFALMQPEPVHRYTGTQLKPTSSVCSWCTKSDRSSAKNQSLTIVRSIAMWTSASSTVSPGKVSASSNWSMVMGESCSARLNEA